MNYDGFYGPQVKTRDTSNSYYTKYMNENFFWIDRIRKDSIDNLSYFNRLFETKPLWWKSFLTTDFVPSEKIWKRLSLEVSLNFNTSNGT